MAKEICISSTPHETRLAILEDDQLAEIYYERENEYTLAGSIYNGRVTRVLPGMQSAFVDLGLERDAFLYVTDFMELEDSEETDELEKAAASGANQAPREVRHQQWRRSAIAAGRASDQERSDRAGAPAERAPVRKKSVDRAAQAAASLPLPSRPRLESAGDGSEDQGPGRFTPLAWTPASPRSSRPGDQAPKDTPEPGRPRRSLRIRSEDPRSRRRFRPRHAQCTLQNSAPTQPARPSSFGRAGSICTARRVAFKVWRHLRRGRAASRAVQAPARARRAFPSPPR